MIIQWKEKLFQTEAHPNGYPMRKKLFPNKRLSKIELICRPKRFQIYEFKTTRPIPISLWVQAHKNAGFQNK